MTHITLTSKLNIREATVNGNNEIVIELDQSQTDDDLTHAIRAVSQNYFDLLKVAGLTDVEAELKTDQRYDGLVTNLFMDTLS